MSEKGATTIHIKDPRKTLFQISGATVIVLLLLAGAILQYGRVVLDWEFFSEAQASELRKELKEEISAVTEVAQENTETLSMHVQDFGSFVKEVRITGAINAFKAAEEKLWNHIRDEEVNGVTDSSARRRHELESELRSAKEYKECLLNNRVNCTHLRPQ